jgi:L-aspartate semialdehyde sulfurtransferase ferredoxin
MKKRFVLTFPPEIVEVPLTYNLIKHFNIKINILKANVSAGEEGNLLLELEGNTRNIEASLNYIKECKVEVTPLDKKIKFEQEKCINCGACTAVCFPGALKMDNSSWQLIFIPENCVVCELCVTACPLKLFDIHFSD